MKKNYHNKDLMKELVEATPLYIVTKRDLILHGNFVFFILQLISSKINDIFDRLLPKGLYYKKFFFNQFFKNIKEIIF